MTNRPVLLLEDDPMIRDLVEAVLADDGHEVRVCQSFDHLLTVAAESPGAVALSDFWGDSHQALSGEERDQIERLARTVPTVLVTGRTWVGTLQPNDLGLVALVPKPFDVDELCALVGASVARHQAEEAGV